MKYFFKIKYLIILLLCFSVFISGCESEDVTNSLDKFDKKLGEIFENFQEKNKDDIVNIMDKKSKDEENSEKMELTKQEQEKIDEWLEQNNLNRYGDAVNTMYSGGTPLFNEKTGESINRYDYILKKYPNLLD